MNSTLVEIHPRGSCSAVFISAGDKDHVVFLGRDVWRYDSMRRRLPPPDEVDRGLRLSHILSVPATIVLVAVFDGKEYLAAWLVANFATQLFLMLLALLLPRKFDWERVDLATERIT